MAPQNSESIPVAIRKWLTDRQADNMIVALAKIGFQDDSIAKNYLNSLYVLIHKIYENKKYRKPNSSRRHGYEYVNYTENDFCKLTLQAILFEVSFKQRESEESGGADENSFEKTIKDYVLENKNLVYVSASDISSFVFCPASYCISKSFLDEENSEEVKAGIEMHEQVNLVNYVSGVGKRHALSNSVMGSDFYTDENKLFFNDIRNSKVLYVGHDKNSKKYFKSSKGKFVGQPDYVFTNTYGNNFVVEEKYRKIEKEGHKLIGSHNAQLASYVIGLDELNASYGYLVYWYYEYKNDIKEVKKCVVFKVEKSESNRLEIRKAYKQIIELNEGKASSFDVESLISSKCVGCSVRKFCGHKTGRLNQISIPYTSDYYGLMNV